MPSDGLWSKPVDAGMWVCLWDVTAKPPGLQVNPLFGQSVREKLMSAERRKWINGVDHFFVKLDNSFQNLEEYFLNFFVPLAM
jgi:hypothetical protein